MQIAVQPAESTNTTTMPFRAKASILSSTIPLARFPGWLRPTVDLFANSRNAKCNHFYSLSLSEGCSGIDAMTTAWPLGQLLYAFPPIPLLTRFLARAFEASEAMYIVLPIWPSSPFFTKQLQRIDVTRGLSRMPLKGTTTQPRAESVFGHLNISENRHPHQTEG